MTIIFKQIMTQIKIIATFLIPTTLLFISCSQKKTKYLFPNKEGWYCLITECKNGFKLNEYDKEYLINFTNESILLGDFKQPKSSRGDLFLYENGIDTLRLIFDNENKANRLKLCNLIPSQNIYINTKYYGDNIETELNFDALFFYLGYDSCKVNQDFDSYFKSVAQYIVNQNVKFR